MNITPDMVNTAQLVGSATAVVAAIMTAASAFWTAVSAYFLRRTIEQSERGQKARIFLEISKQYSEIYFQRNQLLKNDQLWSKLNQGHQKYADIANTQEWHKLREVASCFELMGVLVKNDYIDCKVLFDMVLVDAPATPKHGEPTLWDHVERFLKTARGHNPNQWRNWECLVNEEKNIMRMQKLQEN
jgi:hypothetical protein